MPLERGRCGRVRTRRDDWVPQASVRPRARFREGTSAHSAPSRRSVSAAVPPPPRVTISVVGAGRRIDKSLVNRRIYKTLSYMRQSFVVVWNRVFQCCSCPIPQRSGQGAELAIVCRFAF